MPDALARLSDNNPVTSPSLTTMGQAGSTQRPESFRRSSSAFDHQGQDERPELVSGPTDAPSELMAGERSDRAGSPIASFTNRSQPRSSSTTSVIMANSEQANVPLHDTQGEGSLEGLTTQQSADTGQSARSSTSRQSAMSRLRSRIIPNSFRRTSHSRQVDERIMEGGSHRPTFIPRPSSRQENRTLSQSPSLRNVGPRGVTRRRLIRGPYALPRGEAALLPDSPPNPAFLDSEIPSNRRRFSWHRRSRLNHVRNSIASPLSHMFGQPSPSESSQVSTTPPRRPSRAGLMEHSDDVLPPLRNMDTPMDLDEPHELDSVEPAARHVRSNSSSSLRYIPPIPETRRSNAAMRSRANRLLQRDDPPLTPLSHILHLAASALAAQISGNTTPTPNINSAGNEGLDGPLESLLQGLQQIASQEEAGASETPTEGGLPNVNFLRVFRFINPENGQGGSAESTVSSQPQGDHTNSLDPPSQAMGEDNPERRLLTLVVVGVRSIPSNNTTGNENGSNARLNVDSLLRLPFLSAGNLLRNERGSGLLRRGDGRPRFSGNRNTVAGHSSSASHDSQRHQRSHASSRRQSDAGSLADLSSSLTTVLSESPPGPNPPPSTPADPGMSGASSVVNTPSRRPSSASAFLPQLNEDSSGEAEAAADQNIHFNLPRQRRRSDSEAARHRGLGSGAARRNGVVEPDDTSPNSTRSWLIYVVGANLAENHPALAAPSLFTDNPTYEDMMLLSSLLGPVKPPVASDEEVASAGGLYRLVRRQDSLVAEDQAGNERITVNENDRCLICLSDYEVEAEVRLLERCRHMYHRECIDEWLTTGRNSCPLCRGEGVSTSTNHGTAPGPEINAI